MFRRLAGVCLMAGGWTVSWWLVAAGVLLFIDSIRDRHDGTISVDDM
jgi:hypothetical protein